MYNNTLRAGFSGLILLALILANSCTVTLVDSYRQDIADDLVVVQKDSYVLFTSIMETPAGSDRAYAKFEDEYTKLEATIQSVYQRNRIRPKNEESIAQSKILLDTWIKYKNKHKTDDSAISDGVLEGRRTYIAHQTTIALKAEYFKKHKISDTSSNNP